MLAGAIFAFVFVSSQTPINVFTPEALGSAYAAFATPESITIQSVYPAIRGEKSERKFGLIDLRFVGEKRRLNPAHWKRLIDNYKNPQFILEPECTFHPDHHVIFKKGENVVETVSCFTCDELMVIANGKYLGRVSMGPPKILKFIYSSNVPLADTVRAGAEEWLTREYVSDLIAANSSTIQFVKAPTSAMSKKISDWKLEGTTVKLTASDTIRLANILEVHCLNARLAYRFAPVKLATLSPRPVSIQTGAHALVLHGSYSRGELYRSGVWVRTIDLYGSEDRLQKFVKTLK